MGMPPRGFPPSSQIPPRTMPRRIIPSQTQPKPAYRPSPAPNAGKSKETEDVLKKLKELGR
ncbi:MAG TPA: hypothetical protein VMC80_00510 [Patescibacteria group bacterium]|nr:hypothetical protein [Patescibacteria group bacterium]